MRFRYVCLCLSQIPPQDAQVSMAEEILDREHVRPASKHVQGTRAPELVGMGMNSSLLAQLLEGLCKATRSHGASAAQP